MQRDFETEPIFGKTIVPTICMVLKVKGLEGERSEGESFRR